MDDGKRLPPSNRRSPACFHWSPDTSAEVWHSTPVKQQNAAASLDVSRPSVVTSFKMDSRDKHWAKSSPPLPADILCPPSLQDVELPVSERSSSTVLRQRRELQLLMAELKDRDRELNNMAASHHKQLHAWEQDRQRLLGLEQRCVRLDDELQKRNDVIRVLTKRVMLVETREEEAQKEVNAARQLLQELEHKQQHMRQKCQDLEEKNQSLSSTVVSLSTQVGSLQVREEELSSMLKLKDKDVTEASGHMVDLTARLRDLEMSLTESRSRENKLLKDLEENKRRYRDAKQEITQLKEELQQQLSQSSSQREEMIRLKQELQLLHRDLTLSGEGDSWKDELLELARSKQERTMSELRCLRQVCENQRNDLQLLQLNLESAHETLREKKKSSPDSQDELRCVCLDKRSPSSSRLSHDSLLRVGGELGVASAHVMDQGDDRLSSCCQLLQESSSSRHHSSVLTTVPSMSCGTSDHRQCYQQTCETPPRRCPRHQSGTSQAPVGHQSHTSQAPVRHQLDTSHTPVRHQSGTSWTPVTHQSSTSRAPVGHQSRTSQAPVRHQSDVWTT